MEYHCLKHQDLCIEFPCILRGWKTFSPMDCTDWVPRATFPSCTYLGVGCEALQAAPPPTYSSSYTAASRSRFTSQSNSSCHPDSLPAFILCGLGFFGLWHVEIDSGLPKTQQYHTNTRVALPYLNKNKERAAHTCSTCHSREMVLNRGDFAPPHTWL